MREFRPLVWAGSDLPFLLHHDLKLKPEIHWVCQMLSKQIGLPSSVPTLTWVLAAEYYALTCQIIAAYRNSSFLSLFVILIQ